MNTPFTPLISFLSFGTLMFDIVIVLGFLMYAVSFNAPRAPQLGKIAAFLGNNSIGLSFLMATFASLSTLFLSEVVLFIPCELCWYQRIFMYPQVVVLGIALLKNDTKVRFTSLVLSIIGFGIAIYQVLLQNFPGIFPCSDRAVTCALAQFKYFGYVTIPVMAATAFAFIILLMLFGLRKK